MNGQLLRAISTHSHRQIKSYTQAKSIISLKMNSFQSLTSRSSGQEEFLKPGINVFLVQAGRKPLNEIRSAHSRFKMFTRALFLLRY